MHPDLTGLGGGDRLRSALLPPRPMRALLVSLVLATSAFAQDVDPGFAIQVSPYVTPFVPLSTEALAVAEAGAFGHAEDPLRMLDNPALLADFDDGVRVSGHLLNDWLGATDLVSSGGAVAGGLRTALFGAPASVGVGLAYGTFRAPYVDPLADGPSPPDGVVHADELVFDRDRVVSLGAAVGIEGPVRVRVGAAGRSLRSIPLSAGDGASDRARAFVADVGVDVTAPLGRWLQPEPTASGRRAVLDLTLGYAALGIRVAENDPPHPYYARTDAQATAGISLRAGLDTGLDAATPLRAVEAEFLTGAWDPGAALFGLSAANVVFGEGGADDKALVRRAVRLTLGETLVLSAGIAEGGNFVERNAVGVALDLGGALRLAGVLGGRADRYALGRRVGVRYTFARDAYDGDFAVATSHGLTVRLRP